MSCGCNKAKAKLKENVQRTVQAKPVAQKAAPPRQKSGFRRLQYIVFEKTDPETDLETYNILAEAQSRLRDLGPGYAVRTSRSE